MSIPGGEFIALSYSTKKDAEDKTIGVMKRYGWQVHA